MTTVDIADIDAALAKVRAFIALLERNNDAYEKMGGYSVVAGPQVTLTQTDNMIQEQLPLIRQIAFRVDADLVSKLDKDSSADGWAYYTTQNASRQLAGRLSSLEEEARMLGPVGPKLAAASLHPWIWNAAVDLWDDGHLRAAVQAASQALLDQHLPAKLGTPAAKSAKDTVVQAFSTDPPAPGRPRLRLMDYQDGTPSWISQHEGVRNLGMGCAQLIRNLATHVGTQPEEQVALEQLASMSLFARLIDRATVKTT